MATRGASLPLSSCNAWLTLYKHPGGVASNTACKIHMAHCAPVHWLRLTVKTPKCHQTFCAKVIALVSSLPDYSHYPLHRHLSNIKENHIGKEKNKRFYIMSQITITAKISSHGSKTSPSVSSVISSWTVGRLMLLRSWIINVCLISGLPASRHTMLWSLATHVCWPVSTTSKQRVKNTKAMRGAISSSAASCIFFFLQQIHLTGISQRNGYDLRPDW